MNKKQKIVLWIGIIIFVLVSLNPPRKSHRTPSRPSRPSRRRASFDGRDNAPAPIVDVVVIGAGDIDGAKLLSRWSIIIVLTGGLIYTFKDKKPKDNQKQ